MIKRFNTFDHDAILQELKINKVCVVNNYCSDKLVELNKELDTILSDGIEPNMLPNLVKRVNPDDMPSCLMTTLWNENTRKITEAYLNNRFKLDKVFVHKDVCNKQTNNVFPHFDMTRKFKLYICLNDMDKSNGCFCVNLEKNKYVDGLRRVNKNNNIFTVGHKLYNGICEIK